MIKILPPNQRPAWQALNAHSQKIKNMQLRTLFKEDPIRNSRFSCESMGLFLDYSKNLITEETIKLLLDLADESGLRTHIDAMFRGDSINLTENRPALHTALRAANNSHIFVDGKDIIPDIQAQRDKMSSFAIKLRNGEIRGYTEQPIKNVVNIGIGGSYLGPKMVYEALKRYSNRDITFRFIHDLDESDFIENTCDLDPARTLFIISSKTFTTLETMVNATTARDWITRALGNESAVSKHFVAVSSNEYEVAKFGIDPLNFFSMWDWVGGRYSIDSAIGLSTIIAIGPENFDDMLFGFNEMDNHFRTAPFAKNLPVLLGLLAVWYSNFFNAPTMAIFPYDHYLSFFPAYVQQLMMESNGKSVTINGIPVDYKTSPIYWGDVGSSADHSVLQLIHQGTQIIPCDLLFFAQTVNSLGNHHDLLFSNIIAQAETLAFGNTIDQLKAEGIPEWLIPHRLYKGNQPSNMIMIDRLTPNSLGKLISLYEHSAFTQGSIWQINSFDQWGVSLSRELSRKIFLEIHNKTQKTTLHDSSTNELIRRYCAFKNLTKQ